jgi:hypothetical protein
MSTGTICAQRGQQWLTREDLRAHLAALLRLENVGALLGSGASVGPLGGKTIAILWQEFESRYAASKKWLEDKGFIPASGFNIEVLADDLEIAAREWKRAGSAEFPELKKARADLQRAVIDAALLQRPWWSDGGVPIEAPELASHRSLLQKLTSARQPGQPAPWVFTTNYDLAIEWAAETIGLKTINGFDGLHRREFSPHNFDLGWRNVLARGEARFGTYHVYLVKLHGSLSWYRSSDEVVLEAAASSRWPSFLPFLDAAHDDLPGLVVLPSTTKYDQTVGFVLGDMFRRLAEFLARPQTSLFVSGYSFADDHLNRLLRSALQNPTLQLVVFLPEVSRAASGNSLDCAGASKWAQRLAALQSPQVTIVGGGDEAWFSRFVDLLPDPAIFDEHSAKIRKMLQEFEDARRSPP